MPARGEPTLGWESYIKQARARAETKFAGRNKRIREIMRRRLQQVKPNIPKAYEKFAEDFRSPVIRDVLKRCQALLGMSRPVARFIPESGDKSAQVLASKKGKWFKGLYTKLEEVNKTFPRIADALPADGEAVWKVLTKTSRFAITQEKDEDSAAYNKRSARARQANFPFWWEHVPTTNFYVLREDDDGVCETLEVSQRDTYAVYEEYGLTKQGSSTLRLSDIGGIHQRDDQDQPSGTVEVQEYWNRDYFVVIADGVEVKKGRHAYNRPPYFRARFSLSSIHDPEFETEGMADALVSIQDTVDTLATIVLNWLKLNGFPSTRLVPVTQDPIDPYADSQDIVVRFTPAESYYTPDHRLEFMEAPNISGGFDYFQKFLHDQLQKVSLAPILYGEAGDISGPTTSALISLAKSIFGLAIEDLAAQFDEMARFIQYLIEYDIKGPVPIWVADRGEDGSETGSWLELGPTDIDGYYEVKHDVQPLIQLERMQKAALYGDAQARHAVTMTRYQEEGLGIEYPDEEQDAIWAEMAIDAPQMTNLLLQIATDEIQKALGPPPAPPGPPVGAGTPEALPVGPGGPGMPQVAGIQQPILPGFAPEAGGVMATPPPPPIGAPVAPGA